MEIVSNKLASWYIHIVQAQFSIGCLIVVFQRFENLVQILDSAYLAGLRSFFIACDGPRLASYHQDWLRQQQVLSVINTWESTKSDCNIEYQISPSNIGCSANVLQGIDWICNRVDFFFVLEDDCIPGEGFFALGYDSMEVLSSSERVVLGCGSQFAPSFITKNVWSLSRYALTWGWFTSSDSWRHLKALMKKDENKYPEHISCFERDYWNSGSRRASEGFIDAWDIILVRTIIVQNLSCILPGTTLVTNVGDDQYATHTRSGGDWLNAQRSEYQSNQELKHNAMLESWLKRHFYKISLRHSFTTKYTRLKDNLGITKPRVPPLGVRWP